MNKIVQHLLNFIFGKPKIEDIPVSNLEEGYEGKFCLFKFEDKYFLRTLGGNNDETREGMHVIIIENFCTELQRRRFTSTLQERRGAHIKIVRESHLICSIWGKSRDYGACDKNIAKEIVQAQFPDAEINVD